MTVNWLHFQNYLCVPSVCGYPEYFVSLPQSPTRVPDPCCSFSTSALHSHHPLGKFFHIYSHCLPKFHQNAHRILKFLQKVLDSIKVLTYPLLHPEDIYLLYVIYLWNVFFFNWKLKQTWVPRLGIPILKCGQQSVVNPRFIGEEFQFALVEAWSEKLRPVVSN